MEDGLFQMEKMQSLLFSSKEFFSHDLLLKCLVDDQHDKQLQEGIDTINHKPSAVTSTQRVDLVHLLNLKQCLLNHIIQLFKQRQSKVDNENSCSWSISPAEVARCLEMGTFLSRALTTMRKAAIFTDDNDNVSQEILC